MIMNPDEADYKMFKPAAITGIETASQT